MMAGIVKSDCFSSLDKTVAGLCSFQPVGEHLVGVLAGHTRWAVHRCRGAENRGPGWLGYAIADEKGVAGCQLRMAGGIGHAEYGCHAGVAVAEYLCPVMLRACGERGADLGLQSRPRVKRIAAAQPEPMTGIEPAYSAWDAGSRRFLGSAEECRSP